MNLPYFAMDQVIISALFPLFSTRCRSHRPLSLKSWVNFCHIEDNFIYVRHGDVGKG